MEDSRSDTEIQHSQFFFSVRKSETVSFFHRNKLIFCLLMTDARLIIYVVRFNSLSLLFRGTKTGIPKQSDQGYLLKLHLSLNNSSPHNTHTHTHTNIHCVMFLLASISFAKYFVYQQKGHQRVNACSAAFSAQDRDFIFGTKDPVLM